MAGEQIIDLPPGNDQLIRRGGQRKMLSTHRAVTAQLGREAAREPEVAWNGIGSWAG